MIVDLGIGGGVCISGVQDGGVPGQYVLGSVFLNNVLAVFDVGEMVMEFNSRVYYKSRCWRPPWRGFSLENAKCGCMSSSTQGDVK